MLLRGAVVLLLLCVVACSAGSSAAPTPGHTPVPSGLFVDPGQRLGAINPLVYGSNYGPWQNLTPSKMPFVEEAGLTLLRFPGGNWGDEYSLGENQLDDFVALARQLNVEPLIHVKLYKSTPEAAAGWVRYANVTQNYAIKYWSIGNEPSLYASKRNLQGYDTATFNQEWRQFALAMKAVDPSILLVGPDTHQYTGTPDSDPLDQNGKDWMREFLAANGDLVDVVAFHRYPFGQSDPSVEQLLASSAEWDVIIPNLQALIRETTGRDLPIAVTEVNSNWSNRQRGAATPDSYYNAVWWADVLGRLITQRVDIVAHFALEGAGGLGLLAYPTPRPIYYVYQLYQKFGSELLYAASDDPLLRIYAAQRADGALTLLVVNLGANQVACPLHIAGWDAPKSAEVWRLDTERLAEKVGEQTLASGADLSLPAYSVSLYILP